MDRYPAAQLHFVGRQTYCAWQFDLDDTKPEVLFEFAPQLGSGSRAKLALDLLPIVRVPAVAEFALIDRPTGFCFPKLDCNTAVEILVAESSDPACVEF